MEELMIFAVLCHYITTLLLFGHVLEQEKYNQVTKQFLAIEYEHLSVTGRRKLIDELSGVHTSYTRSPRMRYNRDRVRLAIYEDYLGPNPLLTLKNLSVCFVSLFQDTTNFVRCVKSRTLFSMTPMTVVVEGLFLQTRRF